MDLLEVCIHGEEMLETSLRNISAPLSKQSNAVKKARAQGAPHVKKKKTQHTGRKEGEGQRGRDPMATASSSKTLTRIVGTTSMSQRGT